MFLELRIAALVIGSVISAYTDAKTGLILDKVTYPMIALGIVLNLIEFDLTLFAVVVPVFVIGYALYWFGKIGGGDVKLFTAMALLLPYYVGNIFIIHSLFAAALLSIVFYSVYYVGKYWRKGISLEKNKDSIISALVLGVFFAIYLTYLVSIGLMDNTVVVVVAVPIVFALFFFALEKGIKRNFFLKNIALDKLEEDEVIATEFLDKDIKDKFKVYLKGVLGKNEIGELQKLGVKKVPVYRNMPPFAPFILLGVLAVLLNPELFGFLII
tara:strand:- start:8675 stop:9484 length:810 start_codon:yes stop_codon:yes gene_type:complete